MPANASPMPVHDPEHRRRLRASRDRVAWLARLLDEAIAIPGTRFRFGLDSIIGLIPGVGDLAGMLMGGAILMEGVRIGAPNRLVARMLANTLVDGVVGAVPVVGDLFDFAFRSNAMNARLLLTHLDTHAELAPPTAPIKRGPLIFLIVLVPALVFGLAMFGLVALIRSF